MTEDVLIAAHEDSSTFEPLPRSRKKTGYVFLLVLAVLLAAAAAITFVLRFGERRALAKETAVLSVPTVTVIHPRREPRQQELTLPSTLQAFTESPIYARTSGYLARWYKDIGSRVERGQRLADIDTPEVDQQLIEARAARDQAEAQLALAKTSAERWQTLRKMDAVAQQETDERASSYAQDQAVLASATANVRRLEQLESFKHVYAPFSGVLIRRNTDIGALINAGNGGSNQELFVLAQIDPIRVFVDVPEIYAPSIHTGVNASLELPAFPGQRFSGKVARTSDSIDPDTRTLRTEIDVPNRDGRLFPGAYGQVHFGLEVASLRLSVPVNALLFRAEGPRAALVDENGRVQLKPVVIGRDYGTEVEILRGLEPSDTLVLNPSDSLEGGQQVEISNQADNP